MKLVNFIEILLSAFAGVALIAMMLQVVANVVMRYVFGQTIVATLSITSYYYMVCMVFSAFVGVQRSKGHIAVTLLTGALPSRSRCIIAFIVYVATAGYCFLLAWGGALTAIDKTVANEAWFVVDFDLPIWPTRWLVPVGFGAMALLAGVQAFQIIWNGCEKNGVPRDEINNASFLE